VIVDVVSQRPRPASSETAPLRLGIVSLGGLGGSGRVAWDIARGLAGAGHHVVRLTSAAPHWGADPRGVVTSSSRHLPSTPTSARTEWVTALARDICEATLEHGLEALSVHYGIGLVEAAVEARRSLPEGTRLRIYATLHGTDVETARADPEQRTRLAESLEQCDGVTAVSNWLADEALEILKLRERPRVIGNAVDTDLFHPPEHVVGLPLRLVHASNFRAVKRPLDCIEVLARLRERGIDIRLLMTGEGPLRGSAQRHAERLGVSPHVDFSPPVDRPTLAEQLRRAHVCLVTSETESFGLVALEAMASGVPFVGTRCGGLRELVASIDDAARDDLLAEPGDIEGLADRVQRLLLDGEAYDCIRRRCLRAASEYERTGQLAAYAELFAGVGARP
jgi:L-malate glycosyltransferase